MARLAKLRVGAVLERLVIIAALRTQKGSTGSPMASHPASGSWQAIRPQDRGKPSGLRIVIISPNSKCGPPINERTSLAPSINAASSLSA